MGSIDGADAVLNYTKMVSPTEQLFFDTEGNLTGVVDPRKGSHGGGDFFSELGNVVGTLAPIGIAVFAPELLPAIGNALGATGAAAGAVGSAVVAGGGAALKGANVEQTLQGAVLGGIGGYAGGAASEAAGLKGTADAALRGAISSGTQAGLTGKNVGEAALKGGATGALTSGIRQGLDYLNPPGVPPSMPESTDLSQGKDWEAVAREQAGKDGRPEDWTAEDAQREASRQAGAENREYSRQVESFSPGTNSFNKEAAKLLSGGLTKELFQKPAVSKSTSVGAAPEATQGSPMAYGAADVAAIVPDEMGSKVSKKGGKYPWGDPEGTTALKEGLGI
jgi:hypothetical protein